jgi:hypothetical protein
MASSKVMTNAWLDFIHLPSLPKEYNKYTNNNVFQEKLEETTEIIRSRRTDIVMTERKWSKRQIIIQKTID